MNFTRLLLCAFFLSAGISGCASFGDQPTTVILKHPETLDFVNCNVDKWGTTKSFSDNEKCVEQYKQKGYVVWGTR